jgi:hypothetical protein
LLLQQQAKHIITHAAYDVTVGAAGAAASAAE